MKRNLSRNALLLLLCAGLVQGASAEVLILTASKDNTLYQDVAGTLSNGAGVYMFSGRVGTSGGGLIRRALLAFDLSTIPAGATITAVSLHLNMSKATSGQISYGLHRVTADWGEGASNAEGEEGQGAPAAENDATWIKRFHNTASNWTTAGGDYAAAPSATTNVNAGDLYTWSSPAMVSDVVAWKAAPATNFGWILIGGEASDTTAKRFDSRENPLPANRPQLTVTFTPVTSVQDWVVY